MISRSSLRVLALAVLLGARCTLAAAAHLQAGAARVDITPDTPIRLSGYAVRKTESQGIEQRLWAKAFAVGARREAPCVLITVDNVGVPAHVVETVAERLRSEVNLPRANLTVASSHTHSGPCLSGALENLFVAPIPSDHQAAIDRYTRQLTDRLVQVAREALQNRQPASLFRNEGRAGFAANRRTPGGPVDHAVPILGARDRQGRLLAVVANYACHCTTLGGEFNRVCGDWAGFAQEGIERAFPGAVALITIGCGADANPHPRGSLDLARQHGEELAAEVRRLVENHALPLEAAPRAELRLIDLPFDPLPSRAQWEERAKQDGIVGYHARRNLERLDRGERLPTTLRYPVQSWHFGDQLALVFLGGEVVVDYALRLKREWNADRLWITAYANDVPCYIPSRRILQEGGYEAETSLWYYDRPARLSAAVEDQIVQTVATLLPDSFRAAPDHAALPAPKSPAEALAAFHLAPGFRIELAAAEPQIVDPVAIDWDAAGHLWVVEMHDYPSGLDGRWKPGGRVKRLEDRDGDGRYERSTLFLDSLPFPTGITCWSNGVLICAAPDILYAEDRNGDGRADSVVKLFSGFATNNYQARVNSLSLGLDNWIYGANGLIGGVIQGRSGGREINISGRDFRWSPHAGVFEPASGLTQQGRVRDDFDNWFGCDNSTLLWHYPLPDHYIRRNPHVAPPEPRVFVPAGPDPNALFPRSRTLERFNDPGHANRTTSACGLGLYRDDLLGDQLAGDAFLCEPVHNLVHRLQLQPAGVTFRAGRAPGEEQREFLASRDNWFRPAQVRTGPDGALWIVDMYRFVIEHPRWISPERLATLDVRAGADRGRIYRILPRHGAPRPIVNLRKLSAPTLARALDRPNGTDRDRIHLELLRRQDSRAVAPLAELARQAARPEVRAQALAVLSGLGATAPELVLRQLDDPDPRVRRLAVRLAEPLLTPAVQDKLERLLDDPDPVVRYQLALTLGNRPGTGPALARLAVGSMEDPWMRAAVLCSAVPDAPALLGWILDTAGDSPARRLWLDGLVRSVAGSGDAAQIAAILTRLADSTSTTPADWQLAALSTLVANAPGLPQGQVARLHAQARDLACGTGSAPATRRLALELASASAPSPADPSLVAWLRDFLLRPEPADLRRTAVEGLRRQSDAATAPTLLERWAEYPPGVRTDLIGLLLAREPWTLALLAAIRNGAVSAQEIPAADRQRLLEQSGPDVRAAAAGIWIVAGGQDRAALLRRYASAAGLAGDVARGAALFQANCASCHALGGQGFAVGPDLSIYRGKPIEDFIVSVLDPNRVIEPRFLLYDVEVSDGRSVAGVIQGETATAFQVVQSGGRAETLLRRDVRQLRAAGVSLMPEGLETALTEQGMADLFAYLRPAAP